MSATKAANDLFNTDKTAFVDFTTSLVRDVYKTIVDSSIEQLEAYADLVTDLAKPVAQYQREVTGLDTDQTASDDVNLPPLNSYIEEVLQLTVKDDGSAIETEPTEEQASTIVAQLEGSTSGTSGGSAGKAPAEVIVAGSAPNIAEVRELVFNKLSADSLRSRDMLVTILEIGMQKVVVTDGYIGTKLMFHVDATDQKSRVATEAQQKANSWSVKGNASARWGWGKASVSGGYQASSLKVRAVNERSMSAVNLSADLTGEVRINFKTETFPSRERPE